jgi:hypothetical protein
MNAVLECVIVVLAFFDSFAIQAACMTFNHAYNKGSISFDMIMVVINAMLIYVNIFSSYDLGSSGHVGLVLMIQFGILISCVLLSALFYRIDYKRNVKSNLQIKI